MTTSVINELKNCYYCHSPLELPKFEPPETSELILFVCCHNLFHKKCITEWASRNQTCPMCRASTKEGKTFQAIWIAFKIGMQFHPEQTTQIFGSLPPRTEEREECSHCLGSFPSLPVIYLTALKRLSHRTCTPEGVQHREISIPDLAKLTKELIKIDGKLAPHFTKGNE